MSDFKCKKCFGLDACWCSPRPGDSPPTTPVVEEMPSWVAEWVNACLQIRSALERKEIGATVVWLFDALQSSQQRAEQAVLDEREECARIVEGYWPQTSMGEPQVALIARNIRARSTQKAES